MKYTFLTLLLLSLTSCDKFYGFEVVNKSDDAISVYAAIGEPNGGTVYPDSLPQRDDFLRLLKQRESFVHDSRVTLENQFKDYPKDTLAIYIFSPDTLKKYSWTVVRKTDNYLKMYKLSLQDLERLNFEIIYK